MESGIMATAQSNPNPAWHDYRVATFAGSRDTHLHTGEDYPSITLGSIFEAKPQAKPKMSGPAFLASGYCNYDARSHEAQRQHGSFVALVGDIDSGNLPIATIQQAAERFADGAAWLVYSSAHSRPGDLRWRIVFPLAAPVAFGEWYDGQISLFAYMEGAGVPMDHALSRAGQPIYLPNVPESYKDGSPLWDRNGKPLYYQTARSDMGAEGLDLSRGIVAGGISAIRQKRAADDRERDALRKIAAQKYANRAQQEGGNIIEQFNASTSIETMLALCDYEQSPRHPEDWRSPKQTGDTYATRIIEDKWVSLSASDAASGLGSKCHSGCFGDAYDLYVHYKHGGDHRRAYREIGQEQRGNVVQGNFRGEADDPGWQEMPDWAQSEPSENDPADAFEAAALPEIFELLDIDELENLPPPTWLVHELIADHGLSILYGAPGTGKTFIALDMSLRIAHGLDWHGSKTCQAGVLYIAGEGARGIGKRVKGWRREHGLDGVTAPFLALPVPVQMLDENDRKKLLRTIEAAIARMEWQVGLVVIDTVSRALAGQDENGQEAMTLFVNACNAVQTFTGGAVLGVHHSGKDTTKGMRGSTVLLGGCDASICLNRDEDGRVKLEVEKQKDAEQGEPIMVTLKKVFWEVDGGEQSTLVPYKSDAPAIMSRQLSTTEARAIFELVALAWADKSPWSTAPQSKRRGRYLPSLMAGKYGITEESALGYVIGWQENGLMRHGVCDAANKVSGLEVVKDMS